ncbi:MULTISPECIES: VOC family protein [Microbacterium]|uniref:Glyoxalase n=1 Tax=Microbacterium wangchenii TaxID=2541726 RepID=A0ABX5SU78_9MICO|nr:MULTISPECIES: VOC family protein [Microbacterium]MCK6064937.1 VOC family protein [Microbacterium sp. EYE_512]QBR88415.1 glyoxalase [Microbacterium wangchenii]TXK20142.1 glyoxalase [Microbacterium wangchenii]
MHINQTAISVNVPDVEASADFARSNFGFQDQMSSEGFVSLGHSTAGVNLIFLATGLATFRPAEVAGAAGQGLLLVFVVDGLDAEFARIQASGARVVTAPETEPWGERFCQFADPNGLIWQLVEWVEGASPATS